MGVLGADLVGTFFSRCIIVSKTYPQKEEGQEEKLSINLTMSNRIIFLLLATPLSWDVFNAIS